MEISLKIPASDFSIQNVSMEETMFLYKRQFTSTIAARGKRKMFGEWRSEGLIPDIGTQWSKLDYQGPQERKHQQWIWLNFFELVWTRLVDELRGFNYPKIKIKEFADIALQKLPDEVIKMIIDQYCATDVRKNLRQQYEDLCRIENRIPEDKEFEESFNVILTAVSGTTIFEYLIMMIVCGKMSMLFYGTKSFGILHSVPFAPIEPEHEEMIKKALSESHITISYLSLIDDYLLTDTDKKLQGLRNILSAQEQQIIELLRRRQLREVTLSYDQESDRIFRANVITSEMMNIKSDMRHLIESIRNRKYKNVKYTYVNADNVYIERNEVIKL